MPRGGRLSSCARRNGTSTGGIRGKCSIGKQREPTQVGLLRCTRRAGAPVIAERRAMSFWTAGCSRTGSASGTSGCRHHRRISLSLWLSNRLSWRGSRAHTETRIRSVAPTSTIFTCLESGRVPAWAGGSWPGSWRGASIDIPIRVFTCWCWSRTSGRDGSTSVWEQRMPKVRRGCLPAEGSRLAASTPGRRMKSRIWPRCWARAEVRRPVTRA